MESLQAKGYRFKDYDGMIRDMTPKSLVIDDISQYETDRLLEIYKPDIFCAGIKEKFAVQKAGIPNETAPQLRFRRPLRGLQRGH